MDMLEIWNQVLENLEGNVSPVGFNIHIKTAVPVCFENSTFTISVATSIKKSCRIPLQKIHRIIT